MSSWVTGIVALLVPLFLGVPVTFAMTIVALVGVAALIGWLAAFSLLLVAFDRFRRAGTTSSERADV
jgi:hypothetical protein